jgi:4-amino-4-deoxy-L-arabinose transferase-like glycosyltransferase
MIIARGYYFSSSGSVNEHSKQVALFSQNKQGILEPPIMEFVTSVGYRILGGEYFWPPRLLSSVCWLIGGVFLYLIGKRITDADAALFAIAFYLLLPFAVIASRSFQPDPLMVMLLLAAVLAILRLHDTPSKMRFTVAAVVSSLAVLVKPHAVFAILGAYAALAIYRQGIRRAITSFPLPVFLTITVLPAMTLYLSNVVIGRFFIHEAEKTLLLHLLVSPFFWRNWLSNIGLTVGFIPFIGGLLGILFFRPGLPIHLIIGLWTGYGVFALALNYNLATHDYYQLQLIPIVGLSLGPIVALVKTHLNSLNLKLHWRIGLWSTLLLALALNIALNHSRVINSDADHKLKTQREIGELVNHSTNTIFLSNDYGVPLEYQGLLSGSPWPLQWDLEWERLARVKPQTAQERFNSQFAKASPDYFIVEDLHEFDRQPDLKEFLSKFPIVSHSNDYLIFRLK